MDGYHGVQLARESFFSINWSTVFGIFLLICIATRIVTGLQSRKSASLIVPLAPYWFPWIGHGPAFLWNHVSFFKRTRESMNEPVFGIYLQGVKHNVVASPSMMKEVLALKDSSNPEVLDQALQNVFGDRSLIRNLNLDSNQGVKDTAFTILNDDSFVAGASSAISRLVQQNMPNLVSFCRSEVDQNPWERGISQVELLDGNQTICEANLFVLLSSFIGHIVSTSLMGEAFVENFPNLAEDLGRLDDTFVTLFVGTPRWAPHPAASAGHAASDRLRHIMSVFHRALTAVDDGIDPGIELRDLDDVSDLVRERMQMFRKLELSAGASAAGHLSLYYDLIEHTTKISFWAITHIFAEPTILEQVRKEIAPYVIASRATRQETGFPFDEPPRLSVDIEQVLTSCPMFKACYYETVRLHSAGISFKKPTSDITLTESAEEAAYGLREPCQYQIPRGERIIVPHGAYYHDSRYFSNPHQFDPLRFLVTVPETGAQQADPNILAPFAEGLYGSTNNGFTERSILTFVASVVAMWEIEPTSGKLLTIPGHKTSWGAFRPTKDLRVRMKTRV
ncbi:unnamed protein product [Penicillium salamii]|uniref:Cytochrome P450 n=1 Tax=Penicillium salamii TaxID=1612424 RepID=A0A9W4NTY5_9EURO|nr:unnamed protein product [Penicillium salamii]CAG8293737.1 unnamed protein product [Penicillium salamii]CAG8368616.1 unnamed protein product [Penicillium salamii]CAG8377407.1 unnamed protein product [Penicillium salamii]CAG8378726.1 unnamed protein product [Penicillium salamii]